MPQTRSGRRFLAGAALAALTLALSFALRASAPAYAPEAPAYRTKGPAGAPVLLAEFSDFQCGGCRAAVEPVKQIEGMFKDRIRVVFKHKPWDFHPWALSAAVAAECAGRSDLFWPYHDLLFSRQREWSELDNEEAVKARFLVYAGEIGIGETVFGSCLADPAARQAVEADLAESKDRWINSTPTFFINGARFVGSDQLRTRGLNAIENALK